MEIQYKNPAPAVMVIQPVHLLGSLGMLMIQRGIEPGYGKWGLPGGYMDLGESWQEAGARELKEETGVEIDPLTLELFGIDSPPSGKVVVIFAVAPPTRLKSWPDCESDEVLARMVLHNATFAQNSLEMAFPSHTEMLKKFWKEKKVVTDFLRHMKDRGPIADVTAEPSQGDDTSYYELDARVVESLAKMLEKKY